MPTHKLSHIIAARLATIAHLEARGGECHAPLIDRNRDEIERCVAAFMLSGSGFDAGTTFLFDKATESKLIFGVEYHHMNDSGMYDGWTTHVVTIESTFTSPNIKVSGRDRNGIKDYIVDCILPLMDQQITEEWDDGAKEFTFYNEQGWKA